MADGNTIDLYHKRTDLFWRGITHNIRIIKQCLDHMSYELTSDISDKTINELDDEHDDKKHYSQRSKKKAFLKLIEQILTLFSKLGSNRQDASVPSHPMSTRESGSEDEPVIDVDTPVARPFTERDVLRTSLVNLMILSLRCWEQSTRKSKIDLAEESQLWRINVDNGQLRVRTLDRYLNIDKLPKVPRMNKVLHTVYFVLERTTVGLPVRDMLEKTLNTTLAMTCY